MLIEPQNLGMLSWAVMKLCLDQIITVKPCIKVFWLFMDTIVPKLFSFVLYIGNWGDRIKN